MLMIHHLEISQSERVVWTQGARARGLTLLEQFSDSRPGFLPDRLHVACEGRHVPIVAPRADESVTDLEYAHERGLHTTNPENKRLRALGEHAPAVLGGGEVVYRALRLAALLETMSSAHLLMRPSRSPASNVSRKSRTICSGDAISIS